MANQEPHGTNLAAFRPDAVRDNTQTRHVEPLAPPAGKIVVRAV